MDVSRVSRGALIVSAIIYVAFDAYAIVAISLPAFIIAENLVYAALYGVSAAFWGRGWAAPLALAVAAFNAGRVSRSVVTASGSLAPLAMAHLPLLAWLLALTAILAVYVARRPTPRSQRP